MSGRPGSRRTSSARRWSQATTEDVPNLDLAHTRSHDLSIVESIAVPEAAEADLKSVAEEDEDASPNATKWPRSVRYLILLCAFITSTSFGTTQVPLLYVFRLMTCDVYYKTHVHTLPPSATNSAQDGLLTSILSYAFAPLYSIAQIDDKGGPDRCAVHAIESSTALNISLLGASTTVFGIMNLFITGNLIKTIGLKRTLMIQVGFPAARLFIQNIGVEVWGNVGIIIIQCSQIASILGGPSGYILVLNSFMTEVVEYEERTAALGRVAGSMMAGSATGFLLGGILAEEVGIKAPFRVTLALFLTSCAYVAICFPHVVPPNKTTEDALSDKPKVNAIKRFFSPLLVFTPKKFRTKEGTIQTEYGTFLIACGVFLGILATGYLPTLLQLYSTDVFGFGTEANGFLIFMYSLLRGIFLTFAFPRLIALGRRLTANNTTPTRQKGTRAVESSERAPLLRPDPPVDEYDGPRAQQKEQTFRFDLIYTRFSLLADGLLTLLCTFVREGWQMYLVAAVLPFSAGTGSAAKGTILQMVGSSASSSERTDALAGVSLVENMARLSTTFFFGVVFAAFTTIGRSELTFTCNAAIAIIGFAVLFLARFPPEGSVRLDSEEAIVVED